MRKILLGMAAVVALGFAAPASAADLAARPYSKAPAPMIAAIYDWSGLYLGVNGGWGSSHNCWTTATVLGVAVAPLTEGCHDASGGTAGGQIGYRWQASAFVFGLEAQGNWADLSGTNASLTAIGTTNHTRLDAFGLFTGQVGYAFDAALLYLKGGAAVTDTRYDGLVTATGVVADRATAARWGGTVGAGVEFGFAPNWSAALEYDHLFMGTHTFNFSGVFPVAGVNTRTDSVRQDADLVTVRVNYRWGGPVVAKY